MSVEDAKSDRGWTAGTLALTLAEATTRSLTAQDVGPSSPGQSIELHVRVRSVDGMRRDLRRGVNWHL